MAQCNALNCVGSGLISLCDDTWLVQLQLALRQQVSTMTRAR